IGRSLRRGVLRRQLTPRLRLLGARLARRGLPAIVFVRIVPLAPYSVVNLVAGAARIRRRDYALGTVLGMLPGIVVNAVFVDRIVALIQRPQWSTLGAFVLVLALALALLYGLRQRVARRMRSGEIA
ncbi:MAG: VTT domain-containing protein, partial [Dokdonella sp.]